jgi:hypothetical protein
MKLPTINHPIINKDKVESYTNKLEDLFHDLYGEITTDFNTDTQTWFTHATHSQMKNEFIKKMYEDISRAEEVWQLDKDISIEYKAKHPSALYQTLNTKGKKESLIFETYPQDSKTLSVIQYACVYNSHIYWIRNMLSGKGMLLLYMFTQDDPGNIAEYMEQQMIQAFYDKCENWIFENRKTLSKRLTYEKAFLLQEDFYHYIKTGESLKAYKQDIEDKISAVPDKVDVHFEKIHGKEPSEYKDENERLLWQIIHETKQDMIELEIEALTYEDKLSYDVIGMDWRDLPENQ